MKTCGSDPLSRPKAELGPPLGSSSSADVPSSGTSAEPPIRPRDVRAARHRDRHPQHARSGRTGPSTGVATNLARPCRLRTGGPR